MIIRVECGAEECGANFHAVETKVQFGVALWLKRLKIPVNVRYATVKLGRDMFADDQETARASQPVRQVRRLPDQYFPFLK